MSKSFCPFTKESCSFGCVFNNGFFDEGDSENCNLNSAASTIAGMSARENEFFKNLNSIASNTGDDQTYSSDINEKLKDIIRLLEKS